LVVLLWLLIAKISELGLWSDGVVMVHEMLQHWDSNMIKSRCNVCWIIACDLNGKWCM